MAAGITYGSKGSHNCIADQQSVLVSA